MINSCVSMGNNNNSSSAASSAAAFPVSRAMNPTQLKLQKRLAEGVMSVSSHAVAKHRSTAGQGFNENTPTKTTTGANISNAAPGKAAATAVSATMAGVV